MEYRQFGHSGLNVSLLGLGAGQIGDARLSESDVAHLLHFAVDQGITLLDTARGYGLSEERIGRHLANKRHQLVLSTKLGYDMPDHADWSAGCITAGVEAALQRLQTDYLDIVHLHSCSLEVLQRGEVITALQAAQQAGKVRVIAYSGETPSYAGLCTADCLVASSTRSTCVISGLLMIRCHRRRRQDSVSSPNDLSVMLRGALPAAR